MTELRKPTGVKVSGLRVYVKDPNDASGYFSQFRRIPGIGSMTMPDEAPTTTDTVTIDGSIANIGFGAIGTVTIPLTALGVGAEHDFLSSKRRDQDVIAMRVIRPGIKVMNASGGAAVVAAADAGSSEVTIADATKPSVKNRVRQAMFAAIAASDPAAAGDAAPTTALNTAAYVHWKTAAASANNGKFMAIGRVEDDGSKIVIVPGVSAADADGDALWVRNPGMFWEEVECQVAQMGDSDWQAGGNVGGNLVLQPAAELPVSTPWLLTDVPD